MATRGGIALTMTFAYTRKDDDDSGFGRELDEGDVELRNRFSGRRHPKNRWSCS